MLRSLSEDVVERGDVEADMAVFDTGRVNVTSYGSLYPYVGTRSVVQWTDSAVISLVFGVWPPGRKVEQDFAICASLKSRRRSGSTIVNAARF